MSFSLFDKTGPQLSWMWDVVEEVPSLCLEGTSSSLPLLHPRYPGCPCFSFFLLNPGGPGMLPASFHCWPWVPVIEGPLQAWCGHTAGEVAHRQAALKPQLLLLCNHHMLLGHWGG